MKKKILGIGFAVIIFILIYASIGFYFTKLRSDSYYDFFVVDEDIFQKNSQSYWDNRCIEENNNPSNRGNPWCWDKFGQFHIEKPARSQWYTDFMLKEGTNKNNMVFTFLLFPTHFLGNDLINFKGVGFPG